MVPISMPSHIAAFINTSPLRFNMRQPLPQPGPPHGCPHRSPIIAGRRRPTKPTHAATSTPDPDATISKQQQQQPNDAASLESALISLLSTHQTTGSTSAPHVLPPSGTDLHTRILTACSSLEQTSPPSGFGGAGASSRTLRWRTLLPGSWRLEGTDANAVSRNAGSVTGLSKLPGLSCGIVDVVLTPDGRAETVEAVTAAGGVWRSQNVLRGEWELTGEAGDLLQVSYAEAKLFGIMTLQARSKSVLRTTYVGECVRVARSRAGEIYVFVRLVVDGAA